MYWMYIWICTIILTQNNQQYIYIYTLSLISVSQYVIRTGSHNDPRKSVVSPPHWDWVGTG